MYGFTSGDPLRFKRAAGHKDLFYIDEKDVEFKDVRYQNDESVAKSLTCVLLVSSFLHIM